MLRTRLGKHYIKRTCRPTYAWTQATPKSVFLDPAFDRSTNIFPGMVMMKTLGEQVSLIDGTSKIPYGLATLYVGGDGVDEPLDVGVNAFAVWVLGPDAEFEILAPAFDDTLAWTSADPGDGTEVLLYAGTTGSNKGKIVLAAASSHSTAPVARLIKVASSTKIVIGGLR